MKTFAVTSDYNPDSFADRALKDEAKTYRIDATPWQEDNSTITSATWTVESGTCTISNKTLVSGLASALLSFANACHVQVSVVLATATDTKKIWLNLDIVDPQNGFDDYWSNARYA